MDLPVPKRAPDKAPPVLSTTKFRSFPNYYFHAGKYDAKAVSVVVPLDGIGQMTNPKYPVILFDLAVTDWEVESDG